MANEMITLEQYTKKKEKGKTNARKAGALAFFLGPYAICFAMFFIFPLVFGLIMSFCKFDKTSVFPTGVADPFFSNYDKAFNSIIGTNFFIGLRNTVLFGLVIVPLGMIVPLIFAVLISIKPPCYKLFRTLIYLPGIFPLTATGLILMRMFATNNGFVNTVFSAEIDWLGNAMNAWVVIGIFCLWGNIGGNFIIFSAALENVDKTLYEASKIDGAGAWHKFKYVTLPGIKPQLTMCLFTTIIGYMNLFGQNFILTSNTPDQKAVSTAISVIQGLLTNNSYGPKVYGIVSAMAIVLGMIIALISAIQMRVTRDRKGGNKHEKAFMAWKESS